MSVITDDVYTNIKPLEGWLSITEAGKAWGLTKQGAFRAIFESPNSAINVDKDVRGIGERVLVVRESAVKRETRRRQALAAAAEARKAEPVKPPPRVRRTKPGSK